MVTTQNMETVSAAISRAEQKTSAEVVVTVVRQSGNYDHVYALLFTSLLTIFLVCGFEAWIYREWLPFTWSPQIALVVMIVISGVLSLVFAKLPILKHAFTSDDAVDRWVALRAEVEFFEKIFGKTKSATGVLIFVSLVEHRTVILADRPVFEKLPKENFDSIMRSLNESIAQNELAAGLVTAVDAIGAMLEIPFARASNDTNEVLDQVILKDN